MQKKRLLFAGILSTVTLGLALTGITSAASESSAPEQVTDTESMTRESALDNFDLASRIVNAINAVENESAVNAQRQALVKGSDLLTKINSTDQSGSDAIYNASYL
jgi:hypothetical protein